jgi:hypothetical protein
VLPLGIRTSLSELYEETNQNCDCIDETYFYLSCVATVVFNVCFPHAVEFSNLKSQLENSKVLQQYFVSKYFDFIFYSFKINHSILMKYTNVDINASSKLKTLHFEFSIEMFLSAENATFCVFKF